MILPERESQTERAGLKLFIVVLGVPWIVFVVTYPVLSGDYSKMRTPSQGVRNIIYMSALTFISSLWIYINKTNTSPRNVPFRYSVAEMSTRF